MRVRAQRRLERVQVHAARRRLADAHDVRDTLTPRQQVGVVLIGADEDDRPLRLGQRVRGSARLGRGREQPEHRHQPVGTRRRARAREEHPVGILAAVVAPQVVFDHDARLGDKVARLAARLGC